jgi:hypothetical protein
LVPVVPDGEDFKVWRSKKTSTQEPGWERTNSNAIRELMQSLDKDAEVARNVVRLIKYWSSQFDDKAKLKSIHIEVLVIEAFRDQLKKGSLNGLRQWLFMAFGFIARNFNDPQWIIPGSDVPCCDRLKRLHQFEFARLIQRMKTGSKHLIMTDLLALTKIFFSDCLILAVERLTTVSSDTPIGRLQLHALFDAFAEAWLLYTMPSDSKSRKRKRTDSVDTPSTKSDLAHSSKLEVMQQSIDLLKQTVATLSNTVATVTTNAYQATTDSKHNAVDIKSLQNDMKRCVRAIQVGIRFSLMLSTHVVNV